MFVPPSKNDGPVAIALSPDEVTAAGKTEPEQMLVNVRNTGSSADQYTLEITGIDAAWYTIEERELALFPGDSISRRIRLHPPSKGQVEPGRYTFEVLARSQADPAVIGRAKGVIRVVADPVEITLTPQRVEASAGGEPVVVTAKVRNHAGTGADQYFVEVGGIDPAWHTLEVGSVVIFPGDSLDIPIKLHPPRARNSRPGTYRFTVKVKSQSDPALVGEAEGIIEIAPDPIEVTLVPQDVRMVIGDAPAEASVRLHNLGAPAGQYDISVDGIGPSWYTLVRKSVQLSPGADVSATLKLHPPHTNNLSGSYGFVVEVRPGAGMGAGKGKDVVASAFGEISLVAHPITLGLTPDEVDAAPGAAPMTMQLSLSNSGDIVDKYTLEVEGIDGSWYSVDRQPTSLFPGDGAKIPFTVHLPRGAIKAGRYAFKVRARSHSDTSCVKDVAGAINVARQVGLQVAIEPQRITGDQGQYQVTLTNTGNTDIPVELSGRDPEAALQFQIESVNIVVSAGDKLTVPITVSPRDPAQLRADHLYQFTITARPTGSVAPGAGPDTAPTVMGELVRPGAAPQPPAAPPTAPPPPPTSPKPPIATPIAPIAPTPAAVQRPTPAPYIPPAAPTPMPTPIQAARPAPPLPRPVPVPVPVVTPPQAVPQTPVPAQNVAPPSVQPPYMPPATPAAPSASSLSHLAPTLPVPIVQRTYAAPPYTPPAPVIEVKSRGKRGLRIVAMLGVLGLIAAGVLVPTFTGWPFQLFGPSSPTTEATVTPGPSDPAQPTITPESSAPPGVTERTLSIQAADFTGQFQRSSGDSRYRGEIAAWVYGQQTCCHTMTTNFALDATPEGSASLTIRGMDSQDRPEKTRVRITINEKTVHDGDNPLPDDFEGGDFRDGPGNWGVHTWQIDAGVLRQGDNTLTISNLEPSSTVNNPPWFMLDYAEVKWSGR